MKANLHILCLLLFISFTGFSQEKEKENTCDLPKRIVDQINYFHFSEQKIDDQFSKKLISNFIKELDSDGLIFTQNDMNSIYIYENQLDDEIKYNSCVFLDKIKKIYKTNILKTQKMVDEILSEELILSEDENYVFSDDTTILYAKDDTELYDKWKCLLKYRLLVNYFKYSVDTIDELNELSFHPEIAILIQETISKNLECYFNELIHPNGGVDSFIENTYYNNIAKTFDPNTTYFSYTEKEIFEGDLSTEKKTFGLKFEVSDDKKLKIKKIKNNSQAKESSLKIGDEIISLQWNTNKNFIDLNCPNASYIQRIIDANKDSKIIIKAKQKDDTIITEVIEKVTEETDKNKVNSFVLENPGSKKVGYISLSSFYSQSDNNPKSGVAYDFKNELRKLKMKNVDGLILDLRFNGGGSMREAGKIASFFTNIGPLGITKMKNGDLEIMKDVSVGSYFNKPIVILVNNYSASASEFLAAALRDHKRAIIVGSKTYGKGSTQVILPIKDTKENEFLKITVEKFYRVDGKSFQQVGLTPDILLPMYFENTAHSELKEPLSLKNDRVNKKTYFKTKYNFPISYLNFLSNRRVNSSDNFQMIKQIIPDYDLYTDKNDFNLSFEKFKEYYATKLRVFDKINLLKKYEQNSYTPYHSEATILEKESNSPKIAYELKKLNGDFYIEECYKIMVDLFLYQNKVAQR
ncbi:carboxy terminal-processing peptidase [Aureivirga marina]|uniref:carboxy terminal-processing peptidase n=1 Tax=Aureivirga marina TaxID=1182451 RepID=UPI0018CB9CD1|nr:carboxy terminal-processing peptidase [Aureivirga marina]